jgi:hypothetical protein
VTVGPGGQYVLPPLKQHPSPNQSSRVYHALPTQVYLHTTQGGYAAGVSWLSNPAAQASAHIVLREDGNEATQLVPYKRKAWTETVGNDAGLSIEMAGFMDATKEPQWHSAARITAFWCAKFNIPPVWAMLHGGPTARGILRHKDLLGLGEPPSTHTDPISRVYGDAPSWIWFITLVQHEVERGGFLAKWGVE